MDIRHFTKLQERMREARKQLDELREALHALPEYSAMMDAWVDHIDCQRDVMEARTHLTLHARRALDRRSDAERSNEKNERAEAWEKANEAH